MKLTELLKTYEELRREPGRDPAGREPEKPQTEAREPEPVSRRRARERPDQQAPAGTEPGTEDAIPARSEEAREIYLHALEVTSGLFGAASMEKISPERLQEPLSEMEALAEKLAAACGNGHRLLARAMSPYFGDTGFVIHHSVNVAILAVRVGRELGLGQQRLERLCLAALMHDLGNVNLAPGLLYNPSELSTTEWEQMQQRPARSREIVQMLGPAYAPVAEIVYQVYERLDGSGYPRGLEGERISLEGRIIGAVDLFEAFIHPRPYRDSAAGAPKQGVQALMQMADGLGRDVIKAIVRSIGLYPPGTYLKLSTGEVAQVLEVREDNPMRPVVQALFDGRGQHLKNPRRVDLARHPHVYIAKPLTLADLEELGVADELETGEHARASAPNQE